MDYIDNAGPLQPFFQRFPSVIGIQKAIAARNSFATNRPLLVQELTKQYGTVQPSEATSANILLLQQDNTYTITTAHQNNIFTGPLYFVYKILHTIKLAAFLKETLPQYNFVPVYYIGSEDADLDELNNITLNGEKLTWHTTQTGAVGRMQIDKGLLKIIEQMQGQLLVQPHGPEIVGLLKNTYQEGSTIAQATFALVNALFAEYGLVVLQPDNGALKKQMLTIFQDDLLQQTAAGIVAASAQQLEEAGYKVQANPRSVNLFYLHNDKRERIEKAGDNWQVVNTSISFTKEELLTELNTHPDRFSPNVILRGLYQETILPNIAFIGGGGETAYWLQLKELFNHYKVPFPVLILRNSFLLLEPKWQKKIEQLHFTPTDFFATEEELMNKLITRESSDKVNLNGSFTELENLYNSFKQKALTVDSTLENHVEALKKQAVHRITVLQKKMLRAEKRKFADQRRQINAVRQALFPANGLQERVENIAGFYARYGKEIIHKIYTNSLALEQEFVLLSIQE